MERSPFNKYRYPERNVRSQKRVVKNDRTATGQPKKDSSGLKRKKMVLKGSEG